VRPSNFESAQALLAAVVSTKADVHGQHLLSVVKTCYNIHLMSVSPLILVTAKATLDQMLGAIFQRFEREGSILRKEARSQANNDEAEAEGKGKDKEIEEDQPEKVDPADDEDEVFIAHPTSSLSEGKLIAHHFTSRRQVTNSALEGIIETVGNGTHGKKAKAKEPKYITALLARRQLQT
jgi:hypothetical protein